MKERIKNILASVFGVDPASLDDYASPDTIDGWDSVKHMDLVMALEEEFDVEFENDEMIDLVNMKLIEVILSEKLKG